MKRKIAATIMASILLMAIGGCSGESSPAQSGDIYMPTAATSYTQVQDCASYPPEQYAPYQYVSYPPEQYNPYEYVMDIDENAGTIPLEVEYACDFDVGEIFSDDGSGDYCLEGFLDVGNFRPRHYTLTASFVALIGSDVYHDWWPTRSQYERDNVNIAVSFIKYFDISREDFTRANEALRQIWESIGGCASQTAAFEVYPVDLIFTFDNERINEYFRWHNSPGIDDFGMGTQAGEHRVLFYYMPPPFMELVGRENFIEWRSNRSPEERENESIAVSFVRYFGISREEFARANGVVQQAWDRWGYTAEDGATWEAYNVDMIFDMDNAAISEFFLWENSLAAHEREWAARRNAYSTE